MIRLQPERNKFNLREKCVLLSTPGVEKGQEYDRVISAGGDGAIFGCASFLLSFCWPAFAFVATTSARNRIVTGTKTVARLLVAPMISATRVVPSLKLHAHEHTSREGQ